MGIVRSFVFGTLTWVILMELRTGPELALGGAVAAAFLVESAQNRSRQHRLMEQSRGLKQHLHRSSLHIEELQFHLQKTNQELHTAIEEINRRDAVGSPAARELLSRQEQAMNAQSKAIEARSDRNEALLDSLERLLVMQSDQTSRIQLTLADVVQKLAMEPRQKLMLQDSVLVQDAPSIGGRIPANRTQATQRNHAQYLTDLFD
ncbi:MAG: hypothetical protein HN444_01670 [Euryarchaeota archaeon]|jgi:hypothetical protein|nr:hypothetical protein [Euryarchaeota archaeon]MDA8551598.1 hypothetical protein [Candidatus Poseidoniales archaeon]MDB0004339.1 hypothetical protein [Candidatus Poseidoniaceae archaeon]MBT5617551.1 hypothetical protein [Euryarchaeota archaeon]MBT5726191.1 hypothetical protein [Euryarchaeota archaeon]